MGKTQKAVLIIYAALILFLSIFLVPQVSTGEYNRVSYYYGPIWMASTKPPFSFLDDYDPYARLHLDFERWGMEMFTITALLAVALVIFRKQRGTETK